MSSVDSCCRIDGTMAALFIFSLFCSLFSAFSYITMNLIELFVYVAIFLASLFLISGLGLLLFGSKAVEGRSEHTRIEVIVAGHKISVPYTAGVVACVIGFVILLLAFDLVKSGGVESRGLSSLSPIQSLHAQSLPQTVKEGWVYFGHEGSPTEWNFSFARGTYADLLERPSVVVLRSVRDLVVREQHFSGFTGTLVGRIFGSTPRTIGELPKGQCVSPAEVVVVGFNKIWIRTEQTPCP